MVELGNQLEENGGRSRRTRTGGLNGMVYKLDNLPIIQPTCRDLWRSTPCKVGEGDIEHCVSIVRVIEMENRWVSLCVVLPGGERKTNTG